VKVRWTASARLDRLDVLNHIASDNPGAAVRMDTLFAGAAETLAAFPEKGRPGKIAGTRELIPHKSYRLVYEIADDIVWILALVHTARRWPPERS